ncbi:MAG: acyl-CoA dehydrogenase family protein [Thermoanaerobaculaceae bacterium]|nr:acyl-CoA dehydrogenase family protein [Thermoanaerobaculaceae bacterium]MDI9621322.1 acyl-CoA dehydrogenase family protein [Acidobacteriota bacterium]NLH10966.1 isovaleryl-CoA dehydrogenase [Holophagae bacterium]HPW54146.1 acyl-CoA dehydrogenase family protein [Thermoanaerobaculaceae bacterium]
MPPGPKDEFREIAEVVADFAARELAPIVDELDEKEMLAPGIFAKLAELGLLGITAPEAYGGAGLGAVAASTVIEELAYVDPGTALSYLAHALLFVHNVGINGSEAQKERYLPPCIRGEWVGGLAMTEPEVGSDAAAMAARAVREPGGWKLNGSKMFITNGPFGDVFLAYARTSESHRKLTMFIVEKNFPGFFRGRKLRKMGMRSSPTGELVLEDCHVPAANLVGVEAEAIRPMMKNLDIERVGLAAISLGIARACLDHAFRYARERRQFDAPIIEFQAVSHTIADMYIEWRAAEGLVYEAARAVDAGERARKLSAAAKTFASEVATRAGLAAIQVLGGYGYIREFPVERLMRDAKLIEIGGGTSEILRNVVVAELRKGY